VTASQIDMNGSTLSLLVRLVGRRRTPSAVCDPPSAEELAWLLRAATTVPDHGALRPWRFVVVSGEARSPLAEALARDFVDVRGPSPEVVLEKVRQKAYAAPALIALIAARLKARTCRSGSNCARPRAADMPLCSSHKCWDWEPSGRALRCATVQLSEAFSVLAGANNCSDGSTSAEPARLIRLCFGPFLPSRLSSPCSETTV
jgi:nitroreductase